MMSRNRMARFIDVLVKGPNPAWLPNETGAILPLPVEFGPILPITASPFIASQYMPR